MADSPSRPESPPPGRALAQFHPGLHQPTRAESPPLLLDQPRAESPPLLLDQPTDSALCATTFPSSALCRLRAPPGVPLTTFTVFRYPRGQRWWAFRNQGMARRPLARVPGLTFFRLLGSGHGFSVRPDFSRYALLATWSSEQAADEFFATHPTHAACHARASETWTVKLVPRRVRGAWLGGDPFLAGRPAPDLPDDLPLVVLTRAALRLRAIPSFWSRSPAINRHLFTATGLRLALGVGELPWIRPVTFSVWDATTPMEQFAFHGTAHHHAALAARTHGWFKEDLFARFAAIASCGQIDGRDPCA